MPREVQDKEGTIWTLTEVYAGLKSDAEEKSDAAQVEGAEDLVYVVATPGGGSRTKRLKLQKDWEESLSDEELLAEVGRRQKQ